MRETVAEQRVRPMRHHVARDMEQRIPRFVRRQPVPERRTHPRCQCPGGRVVHRHRDEVGRDAVRLQFAQNPIEIPRQHRQRPECAHVTLGGHDVGAGCGAEEILPACGQGLGEQRAVARPPQRNAALGQAGEVKRRKPGLGHRIAQPGWQAVGVSHLIDRGVAKPVRDVAQRGDLGGIDEAEPRGSFPEQVRLREVHRVEREYDAPRRDLAAQRAIERGQRLDRLAAADGEIGGSHTPAGRHDAGGGARITQHQDVAEIAVGQQDLFGAPGCVFRVEERQRHGQDPQPHQTEQQRGAASHHRQEPAGRHVVVQPDSAGRGPPASQPQRPRPCVAARGAADRHRGGTERARSCVDRPRSRTPKAQRRRRSGTRGPDTRQEFSPSSLPHPGCARIG